MSNHLHYHLLSLIAFSVQHSITTVSLSYFSVFVIDCTPEEGPQGPKRCVRYGYECFVPVKTEEPLFCEFPSDYTTVFSLRDWLFGTWIIIFHEDVYSCTASKLFSLSSSFGKNIPSTDKVTSSELS